MDFCQRTLGMPTIVSHQTLSNLHLDKEQQQGQDVVMETIPTSNNDDENTFDDHKSVKEDGVAENEEQVMLGVLIFTYSTSLC